MHGDLAFALGALAVVVAVKWVADQLRLPFAVLLTVVGLLYALLPGPNAVLQPDVVLTLVIPPLLYNAALQSSLVAIRSYVRPIVSLSVSLVIVMALVVGAVLSALIPGLSLPAAVALGAAIAPPDPVASLSIGRRAGLPARLITVIEGEGLLNDATALTTFKVAVAAAVGAGFSIWTAAGEFVFAAVGGAAIGLVVAWVVAIPQRLALDPLTANAISLGTPFAAYLLAESVHVSGVLAVVVAGLVIGHRAPRYESSAGRLQTSAVWRLVDFLLEGLVFLLIGQQLPPVVRGLSAYSVSTVLTAVFVTVGLTLALRPVWLLLTQLLPRGVHTRLGGDSERRDRALDGREIAALSWAGTRGVITLATAYALPLRTHSGAPFPDRDLLLFCAFVVVLVTLVGQGLSFAPLIRRLGVQASPADEALLRNEAKLAAMRAALERLDELANTGEVPPEVRDPLQRVFEARQTRLAARLTSLAEAEEGSPPPVSANYAASVAAQRAMLEAQQQELLRWRDAGKLPDATLRRLQTELDHEERIIPDIGRT
jgi:monovalent cation/hydrogen antiporter